MSIVYNFTQEQKMMTELLQIGDIVKVVPALSPLVALKVGHPAPQRHAG
jgi:hypothetical protein